MTLHAILILGLPAHSLVFEVPVAYNANIGRVITVLEQLPNSPANAPAWRCRRSPARTRNR